MRGLKVCQIHIAQKKETNLISKGYNNDIESNDLNKYENLAVDVELALIM